MTAIQHEWIAVSSKASTKVHGTAKEAEMPARSEAFAFIIEFSPCRGWIKKFEDNGDQKGIPRTKLAPKHQE
ncbi:hypothetical protein [Paenibacillus silvae]|uniref:Uncharacterized protein n=1 Tax=Paenibacillus silvae TaxID=1325358 RepID=A0A2W6NKR4_9BACL|nr:hypothetical protein [Paenibacillus silvae]PZT56482.1 hypothetical protein DN757_06570 [Paenibacillus silvae]